MALRSIGTMNWNTGLGTTLLYRLQFLRYFLYLSAPHSHQPLPDGIVCMFFPSPSYNRRLCHVLFFHLLTITASLHPSASRSRLTSPLASLLTWISSSVRYWSTRHDMLHCTLSMLLSPLSPLSPPCTKGHCLLQWYQMARHGNVILAQQLEEVQNCLTGLTFSCPSANTPIPPSLQHTKCHCTSLPCFPYLEPSPYRLTLLTSPLSYFSLSNTRNGGSQKLETPFLGFILLKCL